MRKIIISLIAISLLLGLSTDTSARGGTSYILGPKDVIRVFVWEHPELSGEVTISPSGEISFLLLGEVMAEGLTVEELKRVLTERLSKFIEEPNVSVSIVGYNSKSVYVLGEVARPGEYPMAGTRLTLKEILYRAGLPTRNAATGRVRVITPSPQEPKVKVVNVNKILYKGAINQDVELASGDIVYVPPTVPAKLADFLEKITAPITRIVAQSFSFLRVFN